VQAVLTKVQTRFDSGDYGFTNDPDFLALTNQPAFAELQARANDAVAKKLAATLAAQAEQAKAAAAQAELTKAQTRFDSGDYGFTNDPDFLALTNQPAFATLQGQAMDAAAKLAATLAAQAEQAKAAARQAVLTRAQDRFKSGDYGFTNDPDFLALTNQPAFATLQGQAMDAAAKLAATLAAQAEQAKAAARQAVLTKAQDRFKSGDYGFTNDPDFLALTNQPAFADLLGQAMQGAVALARKTEAFRAAGLRYDSGQYDQVLNGLAEWQNTSAYTDLAGKVHAATNEVADARQWLAAGDYEKIAGAPDLPGSDEFKKLRQQAAAEQGLLGGAQSAFARGNYDFLTDASFLAATNKPAFGLLYGQALAEAAQLVQWTGFKQQNNWTAVNDGLKGLTPDTLKKPNFQLIAKWRDENSPTNRLEAELEQVNAIFTDHIPKNYRRTPGYPAIASGKAKLIDDNLPIPEDAVENMNYKTVYIRRLDKLESDFDSLKALDETRKKNIEAVKKVINDWQPPNN
jgi:hypothetical protein